jgi:hypothetical protein
MRLRLTHPAHEHHELMRWLIWAVAGAIAVLAISSVAAAATPEPTPEEVKFFEEKVRPILAENCYKCHGTENQKGSLRLDLREMALAGGESGAVIVPGKPEESLLLEAIRWESFEMPPTGKLSDLQISTLTEWIKLGAPMPKDHGGASGVELRQSRGVITDEDRQYWAFQPIKIGAGETPTLRDDVWSRGPVDRFLLAALQAQGLAPAPEAGKITLIRRLTFDLVGLPPHPAEIDAFLADERPDAYERLVDRLLASPQHGEHWARHWLDLVRYAESDGYKQDAYRPGSYHYRDYVIRAFNSDKPYARFVEEQLAGDELAPGDADATIATHYLRLGIYEYNQRDVRTQWSNILNDLTDVTADVFLGMGLSCARCHDHKFDPLLQKDYYRLQACFAPIAWRDEVPLAPAEELAAFQARLTEWEARAAGIRNELNEIERPLRDVAIKAALDKFPADMQSLFAKAEQERTPLERQLAALAFRQTEGGDVKVDFAKKLKGDEKARWEELKKQLTELEAEKPVPLATISSVSDIGPVAPVVLIPGKRNAEPIEPGPLSVIDPNPLQVSTPPAATTGRRTALARWITSADNPLTSRVLANRLWQQHFGRGLCESPSDFGRLGQPPSHPELLDWLSRELLDHDWSTKRLHRLMVTTSAYRQVSHGPEVAASFQRDPANQWLARMPVRRLAAEQIRDAAIAVTSELDPRMQGEGGDSGKTARRAIYLKAFRNTRDATLDVFDVADGLFSTPTRNITTTPTQSLFMINGPWMTKRAAAFARLLEREPSATLGERVTSAYRLAYGRPPSESEKQTAIEFLQSNSAQSDQALVDFCHVLLNSSEFLYVD